MVSWTDYNSKIIHNVAFSALPIPLGAVFFFFFSEKWKSENKTEFQRVKLPAHFRDVLYDM